MLIALILVLVIWELYWTSKACWKAAKSDEWNWFIFMMAVKNGGYALEHASDELKADPEILALIDD
jgi:hypothetical protein